MSRTVPWIAKALAPALVAAYICDPILRGWGTSLQRAGGQFEPASLAMFVAAFAIVYNRPCRLTPVQFELWLLGLVTLGYGGMALHAIDDPQLGAVALTIIVGLWGICVVMAFIRTFVPLWFKLDIGAPEYFELAPENKL